MNAPVPSRDEVQGITQRLLEGNQRQGQDPGPGAREGASSPSCPLPFPARAEAQGESPREWGDGQLGSYTTTPALGHRGRAIHPFLSLPLNNPSTSRCPLVALQAGFTGRGAHVARSPLPPPRPERSGSGGRVRSWPAAGPGGVLTSPPQRPRVQVPRAELRRRGGPCGHALAASPRCPSGGSARAAAGAARSPAPPPAPRPGTPPARLPPPGTAPARTGPVSCAPRHGSLRCVSRRRLLAPASRGRAPSSPRALSPTAALELSPSLNAVCFLGAGSLLSLLLSVPCCKLPPQLSTFPFPACCAILFSPFLTLPGSPSSKSPFLPPSRALGASEGHFPSSANSGNLEKR